jgi:hypothetical protein
VQGLRRHSAMPPFQVGRTELVSSGFYTSQAMELLRS